MTAPQLIWVLLLVVVFIVVFLSIDTRKWLDQESKRYLQIVSAFALMACLVAYCLPSDLKTSIAAIFAATLASMGWIITNHQNRVFNRVQYTNTQIDQYRNDAEIQRCIIRIKQSYVGKAVIEKGEVDKIYSEYISASSYDLEKNKIPMLYSIIHILNFFERLAYLYQNDLVDHKLFYRHFNIILGKQIVRFQYVIRKARTGGSGKKAYNDLRELLIAWYNFDVDSDREFSDADVDASTIKEFYEKKHA